MAGAAKTVRRIPEAVMALTVSLNLLVADVELVRAALVAHTHTGGAVAAPDAASVATVATAATMLAATVTPIYTFN